MTTLKTDPEGQPVVHPAAAIFPMMSGEELADLAADIEANGLVHPIVLDTDGVLVDGRNRYAACQLVGATPEYEVYDSDSQGDPTSYIMSTNLARRSLTKGQAAMVAAKAQAFRGETLRDFAAKHSMSASRIAKASVVLEHAPGLADAVIAGALGLDDAYAKAREIKTAADSDEARLAKLRAEAPDLADKVIDGELTLAGALAELRERAEQHRRTAVAYQTVIYQPAIALARLFAGKDPDEIGEHMAAYPHLYEDGAQHDELENAAVGLAAAAEAWRKHEAQAQTD